MTEPWVLIAYATKCGSTAEVAYTMAEAARGCGLDQEVWPVGDVQSLEQCSAVVVVAALYFGRLHGSACHFLRRYRRQLERIPVALLVPGPVQNVDKDWAGARKQLERQLTKFPWLSAVAKEVVGGVWNPARLTFPYTLIPALRRTKPMDARDWEAIRGAARRVAEKLQAAMGAHA